MTLILALPDHSLRPVLERAVREVFAAEYRAAVPTFPRLLVASLDGEGRPTAVAGLRFAEDGLFSEAYLDGPVEAVVGAALGRPVGRGQIVEFSSLAAPRPGAALPLVDAAVRLALNAGAAYGLFTATRRLRSLLRRTGLATVELAVARPERIAGPTAWGSYYLHDPRVMVVAGDTLAARHEKECAHA
jgi:hypothetical protein